MAERDLEQFIRDLLEKRRQKEGVAFSERTYSDQPIIQTGRQMRERAERERAASGATRVSKEQTNGSRRTSGGYPQRPGAGKAPTQNYPATYANTQRGQSPRPQTTQMDIPLPKASVPQNQSRASRSLERLQNIVRATKPEVTIPERYYQLRELAGGQAEVGSLSWRGTLAYGSKSANRLFYEQARLMEDFEDDQEFEGDFFQYYPTYNSMTLTQLRGYFTWRAHVRHGEVPPAPLSFAFLHVYEMLSGIGTTPGEQGLADLQAFGEAYGQSSAAHGSAFYSYMRRWTKDYVIYHGLDPALLPNYGLSVGSSVYTLLCAEDAELKKLGMERKAGGHLDADAPTAAQTCAALDECSTYRICGARYFKAHPDEVNEVCAAVFAELVKHCAKRRKTDFVEGLFGGARTERYTMFSSAVFYEPTPHPDCQVRYSPIESYTCKNSRWWRELLCDADGRSRELGIILHAIDTRLRAKTDYPYPLKERKAPAYVLKFIDKAIDALLARKAEEERRRITIDLSQLAGIRAAAAVTQEALLTDEERDENERPVAPAEAAHAPSEAAVEQKAPDTPAQTATAQPGVGANASADAADSLGLTAEEASVLQALMAGEDPAAALPAGALLSLVIDSINDKLFDEIGDAVIEYEDERPAMIEDYLEDVRELIGS